MPLDSEFRTRTVSFIEQALELYGQADASPRISEVWQVERRGDFLCGFFVGEMVGSALSAFQSFHGKEPDSAEHAEIVALVEQYAPRIRDVFSRFN